MIYTFARAQREEEINLFFFLAYLFRPLLFYP